jgi:chromosome partitioning protein
MLVVVAALKGGVGKTTTAIYLSAVAASARRSVTLIDADPQASAAEWIENADDDESLEGVTLAEAPTDRLLAKALGRVDRDEVGVIDMPPGNERMLAKAFPVADCVVVPTRVGGVETARAEAVLDMVPRKVPAGIVVCSARTYTRDYQDAVAAWRASDVSVWGTVPERVTIAAGPDRRLAPDGLDAYRSVWRRALRTIREA